jgi:hypothetical protein
MCVNKAVIFVHGFVLMRMGTYKYIIRRLFVTDEGTFPGVGTLFSRGFARLVALSKLCL